MYIVLNISYFNIRVSKIYVLLYIEILVLEEQLSCFMYPVIIFFFTTNRAINYCLSVNNLNVYNIIVKLKRSKYFMKTFLNCFLYYFEKSFNF